ncbi:histone-fold-containing protein [Xylariaceae sp. FL0255]|nr:histone-fold-containing protein [Xylariaceae sp. FL0255]
MPYNTTAIPPRKEVTGQTQLPLSRVKKIIAQDQDISICSNNAAFVITLATEMFIQYLAGEGLNTAKLERKPRRNIQYKDIANAVSHQDNLQFLEDIVPKTVPFKQIKAHAAATRANLSGGAKAANTASSSGPGTGAGNNDASEGRGNAATGGAGAATEDEQERSFTTTSKPSKKQKNSSSGAGGNANGRTSGNGSIANFVVGGLPGPANNNHPNHNNGHRTSIGNVGNTSVDLDDENPDDQLRDEMMQHHGDVHMSG